MPEWRTAQHIGMSGGIVDLEGEIGMSACNLRVCERSGCSGDVGGEPIFHLVADAMRKSHASETTCIVP
jgi:hypothetical protein